jgi:hypothetical protein
MKKYIKTTILIGLLFTISYHSVFCVPESVTRMIKGTQSILLIGTCHELSQSDQQYFEALREGITKSTPASVAVLTEANIENSDSPSQLEQFVWQLQQPCRVIHGDDLRLNISAPLMAPYSVFQKFYNDVFMQILQTAAREHSLNPFGFEQYEFNIAIKESMFRPILVKNTVQNIFKTAILPVKTYIDSAKRAFIDQPLILSALDEINTGIQRLIHNSPPYFTQETTKTLENALHNGLKQEGSILRLRDNFFCNWLHPLITAISNANFFVHIINSLQTYENIVVVIGNDHTANLQMSLEQIGFVQSHLFGIRNSSLEQPSSPLSMEDYTIAINKFFRICSVCGKKATKQCSICKTVCYCSEECKRKDDTKHATRCARLKRTLARP